MASWKAGRCSTAPWYALNNRVAWHDDAIWYDLSDAAWRAVKITAGGWTIVDTPPVLFRRYAHQDAQVSPVRGGTVDLLDRYLHVPAHARTLLKVTLCTYFIPDIPHAGLHVHGHKGAGKSFLLRTLRHLIDPSQIPLLSVPRDASELAQQIAHHYAPFYDNLGHLQKWVSDCLCRAVTGEGFSKRELYSDDEDVIYRFRRCIGLNGINIAAVEPDILDRLLLIEMSRIAEEHRAEERTLHARFEHDRPAILGGIFDTLSTAMKLYPTVTIHGFPRMADYAKWGEAIAQAVGCPPGEFIALYKTNIHGQHEEVVRSHPVAAAIAALMDERDLWEGSATELLADLGAVAERLKLDTKDRVWPKAPHALTRRIKEVQSDLTEVGITIHFGEDEKKRSRLRIQKVVKIAPEAPDPNDSEDLAPELSPELFVGPENSSGNAPQKNTQDSGHLELPELPELLSDPSYSPPDSPEVEEAAEERRAIQEADGLASGRETETKGHVEVGTSHDTPAFEYVTTSARLTAVLPDVIASPVIGLDTETTGLDPLKAHLRLIQIATPTQTLVIDADSCPIGALAPLFSSPRRIIGHNVKFDLRFLSAAGVPWPRGELFDTMLAAQLLGAGTAAGLLRNCGLAAVVERTLGLSVDKTEQAKDWTGTLRHEQLIYAAKDAAVLLPLYDHVNEALTAANLQRVADIEFRCVPAVAWMETCGLPIDADVWVARAEEEAHRAQALAAEMYTLLGRTNPNGKVLHLSNDTPLNWESHEQVLTLFRSRGHTLDNTTTESLSALLGIDPLAETLLAYREAAKMAGTYGKRWLTKHRHPITGRVHADFLQLGTVSGRMSCVKPNLQNVPKAGPYRRAVCPGEGRAIVKADYSQIELRIAAVIADEQNMLTAFRGGEDLHALTAATVLNIRLNQVGKEHRQLAKALNFGLLYGMGARALREYAAATYKVALSEEQARVHKQRFFAAYPKLATWHGQTGALLRDVQVLDTRTLAGRRRIGITGFTDALNTPVQGTGADGLKLAMARLFAHRHEVPDARLITCVHDEIVAECPEEEAEQTAEWLQHHMTAAMTAIVGESVPIDVETTIGTDWAGTPLTARVQDERMTHAYR